jgi:chromosome condensin MukBEF ATPase and DNA-binding subunit MukB
MFRVVDTSKNTMLNSKIEKLVANLNSYFSEFLNEGTSLKNRIDNIEERLGEKQKDRELIRIRDVEVEHLDVLVDSLVLTSGKLDDLRESSKKVQDLTTSLLCYSLSRFREGKKPKAEE